jgi:hypothetical protein
VLGAFSQRVGGFLLMFRTLFRISEAMLKKPPAA